MDRNVFPITFVNDNIEDFSVQTFLISIRLLSVNGMFAYVETMNDILMLSQTTIQTTLLWKGYILEGIKSYNDDLFKQLELLYPQYK